MIRKNDRKQRLLFAAQKEDPPQAMVWSVVITRSLPSVLEVEVEVEKEVEAEVEAEVEEEVEVEIQLDDLINVARIQTTNNLVMNTLIAS